MLIVSIGIAVVVLAILAVNFLMGADERKRQRILKAQAERSLKEFQAICFGASTGDSDAIRQLQAQAWVDFASGNPATELHRTTAIEAGQTILAEFKSPDGLAAIRAYQDWAASGHLPASDQLRLLRTYVELHRKLSEWAQTRFRGFMSTEWPWLSDQFNELAPTALQEYLAAARDGNRQAFLDARALVYASMNSSDAMFARVHPIKPLSFSDDWDKLLAQFVVGLRLRDFVAAPRIEHGELLPLCARALEDNDVWLAKLLLAHYYGSRQVREIVGAVNALELAKVVNRHAVEHGLPLPASTA